MAVRLTQDNKRGGKNGVFDPSHNDHGKAEMMDGLWYRWTMYDNDAEVRAAIPEIDFVDPDFVDAEKLFYDEFCSAGLDAQNEAHIKGGHRNRCKTMDEYRTSKNTCPESSEYYLGDVKNHEDPDTLLQVVADFIEWRNERYPLVYTLDVAGHTEEGAPHMVDRHAWMAHDEAGNLIVCQEKSLAEMGVPRWDEAKYKVDMAAAEKIEDPKERRKKISQINRYNNRKMTYTAECRDKLIELAESYGVEIITEPRKPGKNSISQAQHILEDTQKQLADTREQLATVQAQLAAAQAAQDEIKTARDELEQEAKAYARQVVAEKSVRDSLCAAIRGDLDALGVAEAKRAAEAVLEPPAAPQGPQRSPKMQQLIGQAEREDAERRRQNAIRDGVGLSR